MQTLRAADPEAPSRAATTVLAGGIVAYPTDTTYALGVHALDPAALDRLLELKGRDPGQPLSIAVAGLAALEPLVELAPAARRVVSALLPGALTLVLPARVPLPAPLLSVGGFVGVRIPGQAFCEAFLRATGVPVTATSANPSGRPPALAPEDFSPFGPRFAAGLDLLIDGGATALHGPSTVVQIDAHGALTLLRRGAIPFAEVERAASGGTP
jgi:L-threonylcarbamoyladenylate synthase